MTAVTPIQQPPIEDLRNIMQVCVCYEDPNLSADDAKRQLPRIRALAARVIANLSEPHRDTVEQTEKMLRYHYGMALDEANGQGMVVPKDAISEREARDAAAVILRSAMTWGIGETL